MRILLLSLCLFLVIPAEVQAEVIVQDFRGKIVRLKKPAQRVVCLIESALSGIYMLKQGHRIVGISTNVYSEGFYYSDTFRYYAKLDERIKTKKLPAVGNWETVNIEKLLSLKPDLVIIWSAQKDTIVTLERLGIPVYGVFITKIEDLFKEIRDLAMMLDANNRADELIHFVNSEMKQIQQLRSSIKVQKRVFFSWSQHSFLQTACGGSIVDEIIRQVGAKNVCGETKAESIDLTMEKLVFFNPDTIVMWHSKALSPVDIREKNQYKTIKAVRLNEIYQFDDTFSFDLWTLKFIYAMKFIAKAVYPDLFTYDLATEKKRTINQLYGKELM